MWNGMDSIRIRSLEHLSSAAVRGGRVRLRNHFASEMVTLTIQHGREDPAKWKQHSCVFSRLIEPGETRNELKGYFFSIQFSA